MTTLSVILIIVNGILVLAAFLLIVRIFRSVSVFNWNFGDDDIRIPEKWKILKSLILLVALALIATVVNLFFS